MHIVVGAIKKTYRKHLSRHCFLTIESEEMLSGLALSLKSIGADVLRGGAFKPRTSPYSFQGLELEGLCILEKASKAVGIPIVTEVMDVLTLKHFKNVDAIQIGSRNMQNYPLLDRDRKSVV